jgi:hypothetical protein
VRNKRKIKLVKSQPANMKRSQWMDNPRVAVYLSPWEIKVSGLPQADHKHNRTSRFKLKRVLVCIHRATNRRSGGCLDGWMLYSRWLGVTKTGGLVDVYVYLALQLMTWSTPNSVLHRFSSILFIVTFCLVLTFSITVNRDKPLNLQPPL